MAFDKRKSLQNALAFTQQGKWDRAIAEYESILKADPGDLTVCNNLGDLYARAGKTAEAIEQYLKLGELYRGDGLSVKAIAVYKKIAKLDPSRTEAYVACADLYWEQGLVGEAKIQMATVVEHYTRAGDSPKLIEAYRRLTQFDPMNATIIAKLADVLLKEGMRDAAAAEYDRAAQAAQAAGRSGDAKRLFQKARDLMPDTAEPSLGVAESLVAEQKYPEALEVLEKLAVADAGNSGPWRLLGEVHLLQGRNPEAADALQRAVALGVAETEIAKPLGSALLRAGRMDEVVGLSRRVTDASVAQGDPDRALYWCRELLAVEPRLIPLHTILVGTLQGLGREEEYREALRALADAQEAAGDVSAALENYRRVLALDPADAEARERVDALAPPDVAPVEAPPEDAQASEESEGPVIVLDETEGEGIAESAEAALASLADLELSFGRDDAALLLDEEAGFDQGGDETETLVLPIPAELLAEPPDEPILSALPIDAAPPVVEPLGAVEEPGVNQPSGIDWSPPERPAAARGEEEGVLDAGEPESPAPAPPWLRGSAVAEPPPVEVPLVDLADLDLPMVDETGDAMDAAASLLETAPSTPDRPMLGSDNETGTSGHVAEQLAEADVYQKYGLEEKARERLLEVVRLAPDNLAAHQRLKAIYRDRRQYAEAGAESLAIARALRDRGEEAAAREEAGDGLGMAPGDPELQAFLSQPGERGVPEATAETPGEAPERVETGAGGGRESEPSALPAGSAWEGVVDSRLDSGPPPDVPLLFDLDGEMGLEIETPRETRIERQATPTDEELPTELRVLLDGGESAELVVGDESIDVDRAMTEDAAEAEFYLAQGMPEEAEAVLRRMQARNPDHEAVSHVADDLRRTGREQVAEISSEPVAPFVAADALPPVVFPVGPEEADGAEPERRSAFDAGAETIEIPGESADASIIDAGFDFVQLGAELDQELAADEATERSVEGELAIGGTLVDLDAGRDEPISEGDVETHYNLGVAYKEMELYDEAIHEFQLTSRDPKRALDCADLLGLCYLAKGQPDQAVQSLEAGLALPGHPTGAYESIRFDLATAYEAMGDLPRALEQYRLLQTEGARAVEVQARVDALQGRLAPPQEPVPAPETEASPKPTPRKKKISFI